MVDIIIFMHANLSEAFRESAEMITGKQENIYPISFNPGDSLEVKGEEIKRIQEKSDNPVVILTDLFGASPANQTMKSLFGTSARLITGVSLPILLSLILYRDQQGDIDKLLETIRNEAIENIKIINLENLEVK